ncbi:MAG: hypothetical protein V1778_00415 [bacterium]
MGSQKTLLIVALIIAIVLIAFLLVRPKSATAPADATNASVLTNENAASDVTGLTGDLLALAKARDNRRLQDIQTIQTGLEAYRTENGDYPPTLSGLSSKYIANVPRDPKTSEDYAYTRSASGTGYQLTYTLDVGVQGYGAGSHTVAPEPGTLPD